MGETIFEAGYQTIHVQQYKLTSTGRPTAEKLFEQLYKAHFRSLYAYACTILKNEGAAEEVVQQVFFKIWDKRAQLDFDVPLKAYLYRAVHNESLNCIKHGKIKAASESNIAFQMKQQSEQADKKLIQAELESRLRKALLELPAQCRIIFQLSRFENLKYHEIASELGLSAKTVENQMGKALRIMRKQLADFLLLILFIINL